MSEKAGEAEGKFSMQRQAHERDEALDAGEPGVEWHEMRAYLAEWLQTRPVRRAGKAKPAVP
ncbi:MAG: hypothetical protein LH479_10075 [Polaromonas sp.]|nr:hypothetical protein [Polaromonas sp.]